MSDWLIWQLADSALPTGGFAHSGGLEAAWQCGAVQARGGLEPWLADTLHQLARQVLPLALAAHADPARWAELDALAEALTPFPAANRGSRALGRAWLAAADALDPTLTLRDRARGLHGHLAPAYGMATAALGVSRDEAGRLFLFLHLRGMISTSVRLGATGPFAAQALQRALAPELDAAWAAGRALTPETAHGAAPMVELCQALHDRLYSRMFHT